MKNLAAQRVAASYLLQTEVRRISGTRVASAYAARVRKELTPSVLLSFVERPDNIRVALNMVKRLEQMWKVFTSKQGAWDQFKQLVGVKATNLIGVLRELPGKIKSMMAEAKKYLASLGSKMVSSIPALEIYVQGSAKLPALNDWLKNSISKIPPSIGKALQAIGTKAHNLADWVDELLRKYPVIKPAGVALSAALYAYIWFNVTEISWDVPEIIRGFLGQYSFTEILHSLPEAGVGLLIGLLFPGLPSKFIFNALLPITVALRIAWLVAHKYGKWDGKTFKPDAAAMGLPPELATV